MPDQGLETDNEYMLSPVELLQHESDHGQRFIQDPEAMIRDKNTEDDVYGNKEERRVVEGSEKSTAIKMGRLPKDGKTRKTYGSAHFASVKSITATLAETGLQVTVSAKAPSLKRLRINLPGIQLISPELIKLK